MCSILALTGYFTGMIHANTILINRDGGFYPKRNLVNNDNKFFDLYTKYFMTRPINLKREFNDKLSNVLTEMKVRESEYESVAFKFLELFVRREIESSRCSMPD